MANTTNTTDTFSTWRTNYNGLVTEFNSNVTSLTSNVSALNTNVGNINTAITSINSSIVAINSNIASISNLNVNLTNNVAAINVAVASINSSVTSLSSNVSTLTSNVSGIHTAIASVNTSIGTLTSNVTSINTAITSINNSITIISSDFTDLRAEFDALVPTVANLTTGFIDGTVGSPSIRFQDDANTGMYRASEGSIGLSANGSQVLLISNTSIINRRNVSLQNNASLIVSGNSANNDGGKLILGYGNNISSAITSQVNGTWVIQTSNVADFNILTQNTTGGIVNPITITTSGVTSFNLPVKHLFSNTFSQVFSSGSTVTDERFYKDTVLKWAVGIDASSNYFLNRYDSSGNFVDTPLSVLTSNGTLLSKGSIVWHSGNDGAGSGLDADLLDGFDSSEFAKLNGSTFTGNISSPKISVDTNYFAQLSSSNPVLNFDASDYIQYNRTTNVLSLVIGNTTTIQSSNSSTIITASGVNYTANSTGIFSGTSKYWNDSNDGAGSGLDADLLDGQDSAYYSNITARLGYTPLNKAGDTLTGQLVLSATNTAIANSTSNLAKFSVLSANSSTAAFLQFVQPSGNSAYLGMDSDGVFKIGGAGFGNNAYKIWTENTDGSGSGLDADLLDGVQKDKLVKNLRVKLIGGGNITANTTGGIAWSARFLIISNGKEASDAGYYDITMPPNGSSVAGIGGSTTQTVASSAITLAAFESLYYVITDYTTNATNNANFKLVSYTSTSDVPENWILIASRNGDNGIVSFTNGVQLKLGTSFDTTSANAYSGNAFTLNGQNAAYYADIASRLGFTPANISGQTYTGTHIYPTLQIKSNTSPVIFTQAANGQLNIQYGVTGAEKYITLSNTGMLNILNGGITSTGDILVGTTSKSTGSAATIEIQSSGTDTIIKATSTGVGAKSARFDLSTATANSFAILSLSDNTGSPYTRFGVGSAITAHYIDAPLHVFRTFAGTEISRYDSTGQSLIGRLNITGSQANSSSNNTVIKNSASTDLFSIRNDGLITSYVDFLHKGNNLRQEASGGAFLYQRSTSATTDSKGFKIGPDNNGNLQAFFVNDADSSSSVFFSATRSGMTVTDISLTSTNIYLNTNSLKLPNTSAGIELGSLSASGTPVIDFHSSGNNIDYDSRFIASGGTGVAGNGAVSYYGASFYVNSNLYLQKGAYFSAIDAAAGEGGELVLQKSNIGTLAADIVLDIAGNNIRIFENTAGGRGATLDITTCASSAGSKIWHSGNDGAGSGLDADLLDGKDSTEFSLENKRLVLLSAYGGSDGVYIRTSKNVASITRTSLGVYRITFTTPLSQVATNYIITFGGGSFIGGIGCVGILRDYVPNVNYLDIETFEYNSGSRNDLEFINVKIESV